MKYLLPHSFWRRTLLPLFCFLLFTTANAQYPAAPKFNYGPQLVGKTAYPFNGTFVYGTMVSKTDTLVGYFRFDETITTNGQLVEHKKGGEEKKTFLQVLTGGNSFPSRRYDYFQSDSLYLESFGAIGTLTGDIVIMVPRTINGTIQLFKCDYRGVYGKRKESYMVKKGRLRGRIREKHFKEDMKQLIGDDAALWSKVEKGEWKYDDLTEIITAYNATHP